MNPTSEATSSLPPPRTRRRWPRIALDAAEVTVVIAALGALGLWCSVPDTARLADENPTSTAFIDLRRTEAVAAGRPFTRNWQWRPLGTISRYLRAAVIYAEDYNFYRHDGIDWRAIEHAVSADWNKGAMSVGGSTITQQLAKNLYLSPRRSMVRKAREVLIAFDLEDHLTKQRLLELYLNVVEWGDGVFGAEAAARRWFQHSAQALSPAEAVRLAVALPNPIARAPNVRDAELTRKAVRLIRLLRMQGLISSSQERTALDEVGAPSEQVLPDRSAATAAGEAGPAPASPAAAAPPASRGAEGEAPGPHTDLPNPAEPPGGDPASAAPTRDPSRATPTGDLGPENPAARPAVEPPTPATPPADPDHQAPVAPPATDPAKP